MAAILHARALLLQLGAFVLALAFVVGMPPASGRMLLLPLTADGGAALRLAMARGAGLVGRGPLGAPVISGDLSRLAGPFGIPGAILLAAPSGGCGSTAGSVA